MFGNWRVATETLEVDVTWLSAYSILKAEGQISPKVLLTIQGGRGRLLGQKCVYNGEKHVILANTSQMFNKEHVTTGQERMLSCILYTTIFWGNLCKQVMYIVPTTDMHLYNV